MSAESSLVGRILKAPGRLVIGPTSLSQPFPYGGTSLGKARQCALVPIGSSYLVQCEATGGPSDILRARHRYVFACFLRGWDDDAVRLLLPEGYEKGAETQHAVFSVPGERMAGTSELDDARSLLFVPDDTIHAPAVIMYRAVVEWTDGAELAFRRQDELGLPLTVECMPDASDRILQIGRIEDLTL